MLAESMVFLDFKFRGWWLLCCLSLWLAPFVVRAVPGDENWDDRFNQPLLGPGSVRSMAVVGKDLYVAGTFCQAGNVWATNLARWDGTNWHAWGQEINGYVDGMFTHGSNLYVRGYLSLNGLPYSEIVRWDGKEWSAVENQMQVSLAAPYKEGLCIVGSTSNAEGEYGWQVVTVTGTNRNVLGFFTNAIIETVTCRGDEIFLGINFYYSWESESVTNILRWDGTNWFGMGSVLKDTYSGHFKLYADEQWIYAAGIFTNIGATAITNLARWDGTNWQGFSTGLEFPTNGGIASLAIDQDKIYASGIFGPNQQSRGWNLAVWDGADWNMIPIDPEVRPTLAAGAERLFAGGDFSSLSGKVMNGIAQWDGAKWQNLGDGLVDFGQVDALAVQGSNVFVGGKFHTIGGIAATNLARWDGNEWWPVGRGSDKPITVLHATERTLYAGGLFGTIRGGLDGANWMALGTNTDFIPRHFAAFGTNFFVGGQPRMEEFYTLVYGPDTVALTDQGDTVRRWNGNGWELVLTNINISGLAATPSRLLASSSRQPYGPFSFLWEWQETNFTAVAGATNGVQCMVADGGLLYLSGISSSRRTPPFPPIPPGNPPIPPPPVVVQKSTSLSLPGIPRPPGVDTWFGRLDGTNLWQTPSSTFFYATRGAVVEGDVFLVGYGNLMRWDGVEWGGLGSGVGGEIRAMAASGNSLVVGGKFPVAGCKVSNGFAIWHQPPPTPKIRVRRDVGTTNLNSAVAMVVSWPRAFTNLQVEETSALAAGAWSRVKQVPAVFGSHHVITNLLPAVNATNSVPRTNRFFRLSGS